MWQFKVQKNLLDATLQWEDQGGPFHHLAQSISFVLQSC